MILNNLEPFSSYSAESVEWASVALASVVVVSLFVDCMDFDLHMDHCTHLRMGCPGLLQELVLGQLALAVVVLVPLVLVPVLVVWEHFGPVSVDIGPVLVEA
jgi:hypothetical protein